MKIIGNRSIIALERFIEAVRDAGYKNLASAIAELIDNALEAEARNVSVDIEVSACGDITVSVTDDGCGMKPAVVEIALQFGGTTRFNSRSGTGRYGMGLPNSGMSQARRIEVTSWRNPRNVWQSYLDVDEIASGELMSVPKPRRINSKAAKTASGTVVVWKKCDRIHFRNQTIFLSKIRKTLGRLFRKELWAGKAIIVCGVPAEPIDPLFLHGETSDTAISFGPTLEYAVNIPGGRGQTSLVTAQFVELPLEQWHALPNDEKQARGISKGAGVSVIRAGREIDYGWFFVGKKRKENYDDWWRCEICFEPELDEMFGVTNTKQGIRPQESLNTILSPDLEQTAHTLNARVRARYAAVRAEQERSTGARIAARRDHLLEPPKRLGGSNVDSAIYGLHSGALPREKAALIRGLSYRIETRKIAEQSFFVPLLTDQEIIVLVNENHPFYECIYSPFMRLSNQDTKLLYQLLELTLLAAARAECSISPTDKQSVIRTMREEWSRVLATFLE